MRKPSAASVFVHLFATAAERTGERMIGIGFDPPFSVADLRRTLQEVYPSLLDLLPRCAVAVNHEYVADDQLLQDRDEVAVIPPVSGG